MSLTETSKATAADQCTEATRSFVLTVKAAARRKYTPEVRRFASCWLTLPPELASMARRVQL